MKTVWKWILGIVAGLLILGLIAGAILIWQRTWLTSKGTTVWEYRSQTHPEPLVVFFPAYARTTVWECRSQTHPRVQAEDEEKRISPPSPYNRGWIPRWSHPMMWGNGAVLSWGGLFMGVGMLLGWLLPLALLGILLYGAYSLGKHQPAVATVSPTSRVCPRCGNPVQTAWKHCPHCGQELQ